MVSRTTTGFIHITDLADEACGRPSDHVNRRVVCFACSMHYLTPGAITLLYLQHTSRYCIAQLTECVTLVVSDSWLHEFLLWLMPIKLMR